MTLEERVADLEARVRQQDRTLVGVQNELRRAARYKHEDLPTLIAGIQVLLEKAAEYQGREQRRRRHGVQ
jgi:uncharacterized coiled-coil protein SlyX